MEDEAQKPPPTKFQFLLWFEKKIVFISHPSMTRGKNKKEKEIRLDFSSQFPFFFSKKNLHSFFISIFYPWGVCCTIIDLKNLKMPRFIRLFPWFYPHLIASTRSELEATFKNVWQYS